MQPILGPAGWAGSGCVCVALQCNSFSGSLAAATGQSNCEAITAGSSASDTTNTIFNGSVFPSTAFVNQVPRD
jgi:hypothetical protein